MVEALHIVGLLCSLLSVALSNIGILIQKYSTQVESHKPLWRRWRLWAGVALNIGSEITLSTTALALAPLALIAPTGGFGIIFNAFLARYGCVCGQKEVLTGFDWAATILLCTGITLIVASGPGSTEATAKPSLSELPARMGQPALIAVYAVAVGAISGWMLLTKLAVLKRWRPSSSSITTTICASATSAMIGCASVISLRIVVIALPDWVVNGVPPPPVSWPALPFMVIFGWLQLYLLNVALTSGQAMFAIPMYLSLICVFISIAAGILFDEFEALVRELSPGEGPSPLYAFMYVGGLVLVLCALAALAFSQKLKAARQRKLTQEEEQHAKMGAANRPRLAQVAPACAPDDALSPRLAQVAPACAPDDALSPTLSPSNLHVQGEAPFQTTFTFPGGAPKQTPNGNANVGLSA